MNLSIVLAKVIKSVVFPLFALVLLSFSISNRSDAANIDIYPNKALQGQIRLALWHDGVKLAEQYLDRYDRYSKGINYPAELLIPLEKFYPVR